MMRIYTCKVRLNGDLYNEVMLRNVTAPEVMVLRSLHGQDGVVVLESTGREDIRDADERDRLRHKYSLTSGSEAASLTEGKIDIVSRLFGPDTVPLPKELADFDHPDVVTTVPQHRTKRVRGDDDVAADLVS